LVELLSHVQISIPDNVYFPCLLDGRQGWKSAQGWG
jgi:hypothetical protein